MLSKRLAYEKWLGIKEEQQPPSLYRLLAVDAFESDKDIIANAADSRIGFVRQFQIGENATVAAAILNDLARAQIILLNPQKKAAYDAQLKNASTYSRADPWADSHESSSPSAISLGVSSASGKTIPQARAISPLDAIPTAKQAAGPEVDVESLVSESASAGSPKRPGPPARKRKTWIIAAMLAGGVVAACVIGLLIYNFISSRQDAQRNVAKNAPSNDAPKSSATNHLKTEQAAKPDDGATLNDEPSASRANPKAAEPAQPRRGSAIAVQPKPIRARPRAQIYDAEQLKKDVEEIKRLSAAVKTPNDSRGVAEKSIVLVDRAIVLENAEAAKDVAVITLAAARNADSVWLARRATVFLIQLQAPLTDALKQDAKRRLDPVKEENVSESPEETQQRQPLGPSLRTGDETSKAPIKSASHDAKWGKTEDERRKIFFDLLKAVDDYGITAEGRKAWKEIQARNKIDSRVTLGILNEGFGTFSDWDQPDGGGRASAWANRMSWIAARTRTMIEPMLAE